MDRAAYIGREKLLRSGWFTADIAAWLVAQAAIRFSRQQRAR